MVINMCSPLNYCLTRCVVAATLLAWSGVAAAVGLGAMEVHSKSGEPLHITVELTAPNASELQTLSAGLATRADFARANITYPPESLQFAIDTETTDPAVVRITTRQPFTESFVHWLLSATWAGGHITREYTALLDPPLYSGGRGAAVEAPITSATRVVVAAGDTLSQIVTRLDLPPMVSVHQTLIAILAANPTAFIEANMNRLRAGVTLTIPELTQIAAFDEQVSVQNFVDQLQEYEDYLVDIGYPTPPAEVARDPSATTTPTRPLRIRQEDALAARATTPPDEPAAVANLATQLEQSGEEVLVVGAQFRQAQEQLQAMQEQATRVTKLIEIEDANLAQAQARLAAAAEPEPDSSAINILAAKTDSPGTDTIAAESDSSATDSPTTATRAHTTPLPEPGPVERATNRVTTFVATTMATAKSMSYAAWAATAPVLLIALWWYRRRARRVLKITAPRQSPRTPTTALSEPATRPMRATEVLAEAETYRAYGRDEQALALLQAAFTEQPQQLELAEKLLEIYHQHNDSQAFDALVITLSNQIGAKPHPIWGKIIALSQQVSPHNKMYEQLHAFVMADTAVPATPSTAPPKPVVAKPSSPTPSPSSPPTTRVPTMADSSPVASLANETMHATLSQLSEQTVSQSDLHTEAAETLKLAKVYLDLGEKDAARGFLEEVLNDGDANQLAEANVLIKKHWKASWYHR